jgi:hypothetical protein
MKRTTSLAYLGALLLFSRASLGCVTTATVPEGDDDDDVAVPTLAADLGADAARTVVQSPGRDEVLARWQLPAGSPWIPYEKATLPSVLPDKPQTLVLPDVEHLDEVRYARLAAERIATDGMPAGTAWFVDLRGAASVAFAQTLSRFSRTPVASVPTFNNWPAQDESVPAEETLAAMVVAPPTQPDEGVPALPVFLLDSWRLAYKNETVDDLIVDNRYMLGPSDLPAPSVLRAQGIHTIVYLVGSDEVETEEDDLNELFATYQEAGITIFFACLDTIVREREPGEPGWWVAITSHIHVVIRRPTVVHDPRFYSRSHGGFGGAHMMPTPGGHVVFGFHGGG